MHNLELGTCATAVVSGINYRVEFHGDDFSVCCADGCGHRWFSTHRAMTPRDDIAIALSTYLDKEIRPCNINYMFTMVNLNPFYGPK